MRSTGARRSASLLFVGLYIVSALRRFWRPSLALVWVGGADPDRRADVGRRARPPLRAAGALGRAAVITLILATFGLAFAFPLAILVALGRRSNLPAIKAICVLYVELIRGVPLIALLFMASVMFPLFLPEGMNIDKLLRAQIAIILFAGAYLAEVVRGGLQALPKGQYEAADALGLSYWHKTGLIILPQALRLVIPPLVNTFIGFFKDTSLVLIIGIFDLLTAGKTAIIEPAWQGFGVEVYLTVGADLLRLLLRHVEIQPEPGSRTQPPPRPLRRTGHDEMSETREQVASAARTDAPPAILLDKVNKWFGALHVLRDVSLQRRAGRTGGGLRPLRLRQIHHDPLHQPAGDASGRP